MYGWVCSLLASGFVVGAFLISSAAPPASAKTNDTYGSHGLSAGGGDDGCVHCHAGDRRLWPAASATGPEPPGARTTMACLSCHDGTFAMDVRARLPLLERPGPRVAVAGAGRADHPVGMPLRLFSGAIATSSDQIARLRRSVADGHEQWWIDTEPVPNNRRDETDLILYTRTGFDGPSPFIECATCHDPHAERGGRHLRAAEAAIGICQACHDH